LRGTVLLITLIKYAQLDAEPQNKKPREILGPEKVLTVTLGLRNCRGEYWVLRRFSVEY
jgi:hypothetical protein